VPAQRSSGAIQLIQEEPHAPQKVLWADLQDLVRNGCIAGKDAGEASGWFLERLDDAQQRLDQMRLIIA
jgi:hypothetical protein